MNGYPPGTLHTQDGRTFVPITTDAVTMHRVNQEVLLREMMAEVIFVRPDFEIHVDCPTHGQEVLTWHEPYTFARILVSNPHWIAPN